MPPSERPRRTSRARRRSGCVASSGRSASSHVAHSSRSLAARRAGKAAPCGEGQPAGDLCGGTADMGPAERRGRIGVGTPSMAISRPLPAARASGARWPCESGIRGDKARGRPGREGAARSPERRAAPGWTEHPIPAARRLWSFGPGRRSSLPEGEGRDRSGRRPPRTRMRRRLRPGSREDALPAAGRLPGDAAGTRAPCFANVVSPSARTASSAPRWSTTWARTTSRSASAHQRSRPSSACCRHGPESPASAARVQAVRRPAPASTVSRKAAAESATRDWVNSGRIRALASPMAFAPRRPPAHRWLTMPSYWPRATTGSSRRARRQNARNVAGDGGDAPALAGATSRRRRPGPAKLLQQSTVPCQNVF